MYRFVVTCLVLLALSSVRPDVQALAQAQAQAQVSPSLGHVKISSQEAKACSEKSPLKLKPIFDEWYEVLDTDSKASLLGCGVEVYPNHVYTTQQDPLPGVLTGPQARSNDPVSQWYLDKIFAPQAWDSSKGDGIVVAILDTGVACGHPDLAGKCVSAGQDFTGTQPDGRDDNGHGTHVAGIAAAKTNNGLGVAGTGYNAMILPVKVLAANGSGFTPDIIRGGDWAASQPGVKVLNFSLGAATGVSQPIWREAIARWRGQGLVVVVAAGNSNSGTFFSPAAEAGALGVAATVLNDQRSNFSNFGQNADLAAPGSSICSTVLSGGYECWNGTSMAAPVVSGVAALVWAACPGCSVEQVEARLLNGDPIQTDQPIGKRVNAFAAVQGGSPIPGPTSTPPASGDFDQAVMAEINRVRQEQNLPALTIDPRLIEIARRHNERMAETGCRAHDCPGEPNVWERLESAGYPYGTGSEVIGWGYTTPQAVVQGWLNSSGHRAIILGSYTHLGCDFDSRGNLWTCNLGRKSSTQPTVTLRPSATPQPAPTGTPPASGIPDPRLPRGYAMYVYFQTVLIGYLDYDRVSWEAVNATYVALCPKPDSTRPVSDVTCAWYRK